MVDLDIQGEVKKIKTKKNIFETKKIILCTGLHNIPRSLDELKDDHSSNVHYFIKDPERFRERRVLVIGGGDTAFDRANMLAGKAESITLIVREDMAKAKENSVRLAEKNGVEIMYSTRLVSFASEDSAAELQYKDKESFHLPIDDIIVSIGFVSSLEVLNRAGVKKDGHGMIAVDQNMETSVRGVFAAGDIVGDVKLISVACAEGIIAAINTFNEIKKPYWLE